MITGPPPKFHEPRDILRSRLRGGCGRSRPRGGRWRVARVSRACRAWSVSTSLGCCSSRPGARPSDARLLPGSRVLAAGPGWAFAGDVTFVVSDERPSFDSYCVTRA